VLGPLLSILYLGDLGPIIRSHGFKCNMYADDIQIFQSCNISDLKSCISRTESCLNIINGWLMSNYLSMNNGKTEITLFGTTKVLKQLQSNVSISIGASVITAKPTLKILGVTLDSCLKLNQFVSITCRSAFAYLRLLATVKRSTPNHVLRLLIHSLVVSRVDYCISILTGADKGIIHRLQHILHACVRLIYNLRKYDSITSSWASIGWLTADQRILYRTLILVHKAIWVGSPEYIKCLLTPYTPSRELRSSSKCLLVVPKASSKVGERALRFIGPKLWNSLPPDLRETESRSKFTFAIHQHLKSSCL
jgi:hypothetical protein